MRRNPAAESTSDLRSLTARATTAERRAAVAQNQLAQLEERLANHNDRTAAAENKWTARVKEYERLLKEAHERSKRDRQGGKERVTELEGVIKYVLYTLQVQLSIPGLTRSGLRPYAGCKKSNWSR
jgi:predicted  nucleic acid-binding Zn-ribbon protein